MKNKNIDLEIIVKDFLDKTKLINKVRILEILENMIFIYMMK